jgi:hypothetical protein
MLHVNMYIRSVELSQLYTLRCRVGDLRFRLSSNLVLAMRLSIVCLIIRLYVR